MSEEKHENDGMMKGSEIVINCLKRQGVDTVFAYPGGAAIDLHQALIDSGIRVILPRHEQGGAFAAGGYARVSGKTGVCVATSGPGATNLLTGLADCFSDSIPVVFITGQVGASLIGKNAFQEIDIIGMTRPIVKHSYLVLDIKDLPRIIKEAFMVAANGRPGPVLIDLPKNIQQQQCVPDFNADIIMPYKPKPLATPEDIKAIREAIRHSKKPCIYFGGGVISSGASDELRRFIDLYNIPAVSTMMGLGAVPIGHPLYLRWLGMHGATYANYAANECDLLLAFGARFDDRVTGNPMTFAAGATIVHVDIDNSEINKNKQADIGVRADILDVLKELNKAPVRQDYTDWLAQIDKWRKAFPLDFAERTDIIQPQRVVERLYELTKGEAVIVPGVGQHQMFSAQFYKFKYPRQFLTSGGLGSMGFGLPAAMGAKVACPEKLVINIDGDGSFQMNIQELGTIHMEEIDVKMVILNNQHLGMVAQWEDCFYGGRRGNTVLKNPLVERPYPDFVTIAKGYGIPGREVYKLEDLDSALQEMLDNPGPFLLDIHTDYEEHVLPMIPAGKDYKATISRHVKK